MSYKKAMETHAQGSYDPVLDEEWTLRDKALAYGTAGVIVTVAVVGTIALYDFICRKIDKAFEDED